MMKMMRHDKGTLYIGPFWMGTPEQIAETQAAIDEAVAVYEGAERQHEQQEGDLKWLEDEYVPELDG